jgi:hypothetical protein
MLLVSFFVIIAIFGTHTNSHLIANLDKTFNWRDGGSYAGYGNYEERIMYPEYTTMKVYSASLYVSYDTDTISLQTSGALMGSFWINSDGYWAVMGGNCQDGPSGSGACLYNPNMPYWTYVDEYASEVVNVDLETSCTNVSTPKKCTNAKYYAGKVIDPGSCGAPDSCGNYGSCGNSVLVTIKTNREDKVLSMSIHRTIYSIWHNKVVKYVGNLIINPNTFVPGEPGYCDTQLPDCCQSRPQSYCSAFYPRGFSYDVCK